MIGVHDPAGLSSELRMAHAEIERLRAALAEIAREDHDEDAVPGPYSKIAARALEQEQSRKHPTMVEAEKLVSEYLFGPSVPEQKAGAEK